MKLFKRKRRSVEVDPRKDESKFWNIMAKSFATTSKQLIWVYTINSTLWITASYVLAFLGHDQIAESLSTTVCTIVIGQIGLYFLTKTTENIFRYNDGIGGKSTYPPDVAAANTVSPESVGINPDEHTIELSGPEPYETETADAPTKPEDPVPEPADTEVVG